MIFTKDDKIRIAEALAEAGVHRIEAGMPVVSPSDTAAIKEIVKRNLGPQIFAFSRCMVDDVKRAVDCGVTGIVMEVPSSTHIIQYAYKWQLEKAIDLSIESTAYAHSQGLEVVFFPIDFSRAEMNWVLDLITRVANEGHMDALALVDTFGVLAPHAMQYLVREARSASTSASKRISTWTSAWASPTRSWLSPKASRSCTPPCSAWANARAMCRSKKPRWPCSRSTASTSASSTTSSTASQIS